jgi:hypothetical protein
MAPIWQRYFEDCDCVSYHHHHHHHYHHHHHNNNDHDHQQHHRPSAHSHSSPTLHATCFCLRFASHGNLLACTDPSVRYSSLLMPVMHPSSRICTNARCTVWSPSVCLHSLSPQSTAAQFFFLSAWSTWRASPLTLPLLARPAPSLSPPSCACRSPPFYLLLSPGKPLVIAFSKTDGPCPIPRNDLANFLR